MKRIVVGFDGSENSHKALERAADLADGAVVAVVCSADVRRLMRDPAGGASAIDPADEEARSNALAEAREYLEGRSIEGAYVEGVESGRRHGPGGGSVGRRSDRGRHQGLHATKRLFLGSVSTKVVHHAPCDVLVVR